MCECLPGRTYGQTARVDLIDTFGPHAFLFRRLTWNPQLSTFSRFTANSWMYILNIVLLICQMCVGPSQEVAIVVFAWRPSPAGLRLSVYRIVSQSIVNRSGLKHPVYFLNFLFPSPILWSLSVCVNDPASSSSSSVFRICAIKKKMWFWVLYFIQWKLYGCHRCCILYKYLYF